MFNIIQNISATAELFELFITYQHMETFQNSVNDELVFSTNFQFVLRTYN